MRETRARTRQDRNVVVRHVDQFHHHLGRRRPGRQSGHRQPVVHSGEATLVARKDRLDKLKSLVEGLKDSGFWDFI
jgi:hypothetical protein